MHARTTAWLQWSDGDTWSIEEVLVGDRRRRVATLGVLQADSKGRVTWWATRTASGLPLCDPFKPPKDRNDTVTLEWGPECNKRASSSSLHSRRTRPLLTGCRPAAQLK